MTQDQKPREDAEARTSAAQQSNADGAPKQAAPEATGKKKRPLLSFKRLAGRDPLKYEDVADK
ncbi:MAG: hypothetical protein CMK00_05685 [Planctomycetes bacterium]|jgi:hypothetical protein|nr:hypothetical protein [Planctomycetota bacterium]HJO26249.1 hypothetical protein [Planctomycetota bacterium]